MSSLLSPFHIGPKHAQFYVQVTLHEVTNVPLLSGEFAVSWKVHHAVSPSSRKQNAALGQLNLEADGESKHRLRISTSRDDMGLRRSNSHRTAQSPASDMSSAMRSTDSLHLASPERISTSRSNNSLAPEDGVLGSSPPSTFSWTRNRSASDASRSVESLVEDQAKSPGEPARNRVRQLRENEGRRTRHRSGSFTGRHAPFALQSVHIEPKGHTPFERVQQHSVKFERKFDAVVRVPITKSDEQDNKEALGALGQSHLRINVQQLLRTNTSGTQQQESLSQLGFVNVNLAEYAPKAGQGTPSSTPSSHSSPASTSRTEMRQYLLSECSSNAMLRLSVEMRFLDGTPLYRVPPIRGGIEDLASFMMPSDLSTDLPHMPTSPTKAESEAEQRPVYAANAERPGLEWHYKLPMSLLFRATAVSPEHLREPKAAASTCDTRPGGHLMTCNASAPRMMYCDTNTEELIDDLFKGHLGPMADERQEEPTSPTSTSDDSQRRSRAARLRWDKIIKSVGQIAQQADPTRPLRQSSGDSNHSHGSSGPDSRHHTPQLRDIVDYLRHGTTHSHEGHTEHA